MNRPEPLLIRADASERIGTGHVMRMIALAQAYQDRGGAVTIACATCPDIIAERVRYEKIAFKKLKSDSPGSTADLDETIAHAKSLGSKWVVLDGYHFGIDYQRKLRQAGFRVMAVDDYGHCETWAADVVLNQNIFAPELKYHSEVEGCRFLLGTRFALLRREFRVGAKHRQTLDTDDKKTKCPPIQRLLVTLGGADPDNATGKILAMLNSITEVSLEIKLIVGGSNPHFDSLRQISEASPHKIDLLQNVSDMPSLYGWADGVISAGGSTCWEWLRYGLPACVISIADNQKATVNALSKSKFAYPLENIGILGHSESLGTIRRFFDGSRDLNVAPATQVVDAKGATRLSALLDGPLRITIATASIGWLKPLLNDFEESLRQKGHTVRTVTEPEAVQTGDILLLLSFWGIMPTPVLARNTHNLVIHASDLPKGRGWSPLSWQIIEGQNRIPLSLLEAEAKVDSGVIYDQLQMELQGHELLPELRRKLAEETFALCSKFIQHYPVSATWGRVQQGNPTYYPRRKPSDSQLDPFQSIANQFNLLRVVDNESYPAYFTLNGHKYILKIEKDEHEDI